MALDLKGLPKLLREGRFFYCSNCNQHVTSKTTGYRHVKVCMEKLPPSKDFEEEKPIEQYNDSNKTTTQTDENDNYQCNTCLKTFKLRHSLYKHEKYCGINYSFAPHKEIVEEEILNCKSCGDSFESSIALHRHEKTCEPNLFICNVCGEGFDSIKMLCVHEISHSREKAKKEVPCEEDVHDAKKDVSSTNNGHEVTEVSHNTITEGLGNVNLKKNSMENNENNVTEVNMSSDEQYIVLNSVAGIKEKIDEHYNALNNITGIKQEVEEQYTVLVIENDCIPKYEEELTKVTSIEANGFVTNNNFGHSVQSEEFPCQYCEKKLKTRTALDKHEQKCKLDQEKKFVPKLIREGGKLYCGRCRLHVTSKTVGYRHEKICARKAAFAGRNLNEGSSKLGELNDTNSIKGQDTGVYHCNICLRNFSYGQSFQKHIKICGSTNRMFKQIKENIRVEDDRNLKLSSPAVKVGDDENHSYLSSAVKVEEVDLEYSSSSSGQTPMDVVSSEQSPAKKSLEVIENDTNGIEEVDDQITVVVMANDFETDDNEEKTMDQPDIKVNGSNSLMKNENLNQSVSSDISEIFNCKYCGRSCNGRTAMNKHQQRCKLNMEEKTQSLPKLVREGDKFYCGRCRLHVTSKTTGYRHVKMCMRNPLYDDDDKSLNDKSVEDLHVANPISINEDGTYNCNVCLRSFTYRQSFQKHVKVCGASHSYRRSRDILLQKFSS